MALFAFVVSFPANLKAGFQELSPENGMLDFYPSIAWVSKIYYLLKIVFRLRHLTKNDNAEEYSGQFEGDIVLSQAQLLGLMTRNGLINKTYRWSNNIVPYVIADNTFSKFF